MTNYGIVHKVIKAEKHYSLEKLHHLWQRL